MKEYRVTKYNPKYRNEDGAYSRSEWTSYCDIGDLVSNKQYENVENSYIESALDFIEEQNIENMTITCIENEFSYTEAGVTLEVGRKLNKNEIKNVVRSILREKYWAKLENKKSFIHFGYDYYMYIGVPNEPIQAMKRAKAKGLYVEEFTSPYHDE